MPEFDWYRELGTFPLAWFRQGDEWLYWLSQAVIDETSDVRVSGHKWDDTTRPFVQVSLTLSGSPLDMCVLVAAGEDAVMVLAAGGDVPDSNLLSSLAGAAQVASDRLGETGTDHAWTAVIGRPTSGGVPGLEKRLEGSAAVGPLQLQSTEVVLVEPDTAEQTSISSWSIAQSVPIRVRGSSRGYSWVVAAGHAARDLRTLCGLLSVAWDCELAVREAAAPVEWGMREVPKQPPWYSPDAPPMLGALPEPATVPAWIDNAWTNAQEDAQLLAALDSFLEGLYASGRHPSLAAVAFTACVETLGSQVFEPQRCGTCGTRTGITRTFKAALRLVLTEDEAAQLDAVYGERSGTVHRGRLHGGETTPGAQFLGVWSQNPARDFRWRTLWNLRRACRLLLRAALVEGLPVTQALEER